MPVPARGWTSPVRVCNSCRDILSKKRDARPGEIQLTLSNIILELIEVVFFVSKSFCIRDVYHSNHKFVCKINKDVTKPTTVNSPAGAYNGINAMTDDQDIRVRKYGEVVYNTLTQVASVLEYPKGEIRD